MSCADLIPRQRQGAAKARTFPPFRRCGTLLPLGIVVLSLIGLSVGGTSAKILASESPSENSSDWTYWRGPTFDGTSSATGLVDELQFGEAGTGHVVWRRDDLGGRSTPIVMQGRLYTLVRAEPETPREGEKVVCVDIQTGKTLWENRFNVWLSDVPDTRVGWSSVVGDPESGHVYALGVCGYFLCIDGETGETVWSVPLHERFGLLSTYGGRTNFPLVCDDLVIISGVVIGWGEMARPAHRLIGFDKSSGEVIWFNGTRPLPYDTTYSAPVLTVLNGQKAMIFGSGDGQVWALQPRTGRPLWNYEFSRRGLNVSPIVVGDTVFIGHSEENINTTAMGAMVALKATGEGNITKTGERWRVEELMVGKASPLHVDGRLYCFDDRAKLHVLDAETGERIVRPIPLRGTALRASPLYADGKIYAFSTSAWAILEPDARRGARAIDRGRLADGEEIHASPVVSNRTLFIQTTSAMYAFRDESKEAATAAADTGKVSAAGETDVAEDPKPAHLQLVPAEVLLRPEESVQFRARLFNAKGQLLREEQAELRVEGPGTVDAEGRFTAPAEAVHQATYVTAHVGDLTGQARMRIVPDLPWSFDFEGLNDPPVTWVGARYRHVVREMDGNKVMVKITTIPKGTRSRAWFGHSDLKDYTIQADVKGAIQDEKMPDIGLIAQGYAIDLQGAAQKLEIRTWVPQRRMAQAVDFDWKPDQWYTLKLQASNEDGQAVLRGKAWPRGEQEPDDWTVVATDIAPNVTGSPGLYGNAKDAEIHLDNITVTPN